MARTRRHLLHAVVPPTDDSTHAWTPADAGVPLCPRASFVSLPSVAVKRR
jgi:hypothetical protein